MTTRFQERSRVHATLAAILISIAAILSLSHTGAAQKAHDYTVTVDPVTTCSAETTVSGTVTLTGLTTGYGFYVQIRGDGEILDGQAFEGHDGYPNSTYDWSVTGDLSGTHNVVDLYVAMYDGELDLIRDETIPLTPACASGTAVVTASATAAMVRTTYGNSVTSLPATGAGGTSDADIVLVVAFTGTTVLGLAGLALLDRKPEIE